MTDKDNNINKVPNEGRFPKLRFPEFTDEWKQTFLKEIAEKVNTKNNDEKIDLVFSNSAVQGIVLQNDYFDKSIANKNNLNGYYVVKPFDFVYNPRISASAEVGAMNVNKTNETGLVSPLYTVFRLKSDNIENPFLEFLFKSKVWHNYMRSIANYGARDDRMNVKNEDFFEMPILIPKITEQKKIVFFLSSIEDKLQTQKKTIEELNAFKKGIAKKIFSQQLRFKDDTSASLSAGGNNFPEWKEIDLGNVCEIKKGEQFNKEELDETGLYPCLNGGISPSGFSEKYNTAENTITISEGGNSCGFVNFMTTKFWLGGHCYKILLSQNINLLYFYQLLKYNEQKIMSLRVGSGLPNIQLKDLKRLKIKISLAENEQQKIANFLSSIDSKIDIENQILQKLEEQKKYLLANMFV